MSDIPESTIGAGRWLKKRVMCADTIACAAACGLVVLSVTVMAGLSIADDLADELDDQQWVVDTVNGEYTTVSQDQNTGFWWLKLRIRTRVPESEMAHIHVVVRLRNEDHWKLLAYAPSREDGEHVGNYSQRLPFEYAEGMGVQVGIELRSGRHPSRGDCGSIFRAGKMLVLDRE